MEKETLVLDWLRINTDAPNWIKVAIIKAIGVTPEQLWEVCPEPCWLLQVLMENSKNSLWPSEKQILSLVCDVVEKYALKPLEGHAEHEIMRLCLETSRSYLRNQCFKDDVTDAIKSVYDINPRKFHTDSLLINKMYSAIYSITSTGASVQNPSPAHPSTAVGHAVMVSAYQACFMFNTSNSQPTSEQVNRIQQVISDYIRNRVTVPL